MRLVEWRLARSATEGSTVQPIESIGVEPAYIAGWVVPKLRALLGGLSKVHLL